MMWWDDGGWNAGAWVVMSLMMVVFWGGLIALAAWLVHTLRGDAGGSRSEPLRRPEDVLAERFARGEIDEDEYARRTAALEAHRSSR